MTQLSSDRPDTRSVEAVADTFPLPCTSRTALPHELKRTARLHFVHHPDTPFAELFLSTKGDVRQGQAQSDNFRQNKVSSVLSSFRTNEIDARI